MRDTLGRCGRDLPSDKRTSVAESRPIRVASPARAAIQVNVSCRATKTPPLPAHVLANVDILTDDNVLVVGVGLDRFGRQMVSRILEVFWILGTAIIFVVEGGRITVVRE
jgi:hypothetical protein